MNDSYIDSHAWLGITSMMDEKQNQTEYTTIRPVLSNHFLKRAMWSPTAGDNFNQEVISAAKYLL